MSTMTLVLVALLVVGFVVSQVWAVRVLFDVAVLVALLVVLLGAAW